MRIWMYVSLGFSIFMAAWSLYSFWSTDTDVAVSIIMAAIVFIVMFVSMYVPVFIVWKIFSLLLGALNGQTSARPRRIPEPTQAPSPRKLPRTPLAVVAPDPPSERSTPVPARENRIDATPREIRSDKDLDEIHSYVVLDTETTGLDRRDDAIIEIAMIAYDDGKEVERFSTFINPGRPISPSASRVNHIHDADVADAPSIDAVMPDVLRLLSGRVVIGHSVTFDLAFLGYAVPPEAGRLSVEYVDTIPLARRAFPGRSTYKLSALARDLGLSDTQEHRALGDVLLTARLFKACRDQMYQKRTSDLAARRAAREKAKAERAAQFSWSPLMDSNFVFSGNFKRNREQLESLLQLVGANLRDQVNGNTDYLVTGDLSTLPGWALERKYGKAQALAESGKKVRIINENEYIALLGTAMQASPRSTQS